MTSIDWQTITRQLAQRDYGADLEQLCRRAAALVALFYAAGYCLGNAVHRLSGALAALTHKRQSNATPTPVAAAINKTSAPSAALTTAMAKPMPIEPAAIAAVTSTQPSSRRRARRSKAT